MVALHEASGRIAEACRSLARSQQTLLLGPPQASCVADLLATCLATHAHLATPASELGAIGHSSRGSSSPSEKLVSWPAGPVTGRGAGSDAATSAPSQWGCVQEQKDAHAARAAAGTTTHSSVPLHPLHQHRHSLFAAGAYVHGGHSAHMAGAWAGRRHYAARAAAQASSAGSMELDIAALLNEQGDNAAAARRRALTPAAIVTALDAHIVGQADAKRAVAVALRNRWRRQQVRWGGMGRQQKGGVDRQPGHVMRLGKGGGIAGWAGLHPTLLSTAQVHASTAHLAYSPNQVG